MSVKGKNLTLNNLQYFDNILQSAVGWSAVCDCGIPDHTHLLFIYQVQTVSRAKMIAAPCLLSELSSMNKKERRQKSGIDTIKPHT